ncbi:MAG: DEAD/DEAH box helicase family protein, partial [Actinobacteria bacterium]|nr:DEAD/DEAH box helicase family protein [Actinomycetota bacterium]
MAKFKTPKDQAVSIDSPESLFRSLRPTDGQVRHLWAHQADLLRDYQKLSPATPDVAIELPTGAGKTLVGQLVGEYRRRVGGQRVAYLCPTIQLAKQAKEKADAYGIPPVLLVGPQRDYDRVDVTAFNRGQTMAISTYWGVFNSNPALGAQTLILDDAHSGENAVAGMWSVEAERGDPLYAAIVSPLIDALPEAFAERLKSEGSDPYRRRVVELVPPLVMHERADVLRDALTEHAAGSNKWAAAMVADQVQHCLCFVSGEGVLLRPLIAPTTVHPPFAAAQQRVYMSATLGSGGELERTFGIEEITRLPVPAGWDEHGSGRRFFIFPGAALDEAGADGFTVAAMERARRALVLAPSGREVESMIAAVPERFNVLYTRDAEQDLNSLLESSDGAAFLANRYDGIDLPDDACRLMVLSGLPAATHLLERFLYET